MGNGQIDYFLFPNLALPEKDLRNLFIFVPRLNILEITRPATVPEWGSGKFFGRPAIGDPEFLAQTKSCIQSYRAFAETHGESGGTLAYLIQTLDDMSDSRFKIQEQLRGKCPAALDAGQAAILRAVVFLEIARELDEKEFELESSMEEADAIEKKFSEILGITEEDELTELSGTVSSPLAPESYGARYMLPERIENWFRLFSTLSRESMPVFVANNPETLEEAFELVRAGCRRSGTDFSSATFSLGSFPRLDELGQKQVLSLIEAPGTPALLASYHEELDNFLLAAAAGDRDKLEAKAESMSQILEKFCKTCNIPGTDRVTLTASFPQDLTLTGVFDIFSTPSLPTTITGGQDAPALFLCLG